MIMICEIDGLTQNERVFRRGMAFVLDESTTKEIRSMSDAQLEAKQKRMFGRRIYRKPFPDELIFAYKTKQIRIDDMEKEEKKFIIEFLKEDGERKISASQALEEAIDVDEPSAPKKEVKE